MRTEEEMVAYALETTPSLLPYIPELLEDIEELGSDAELIARVVGNLELPAKASVIDLGCGKGAVSVELAEECGHSVLGIELFEPFLRSCRELAVQRGVSELCTFRHGDILKLSGKLELADVAIVAGLGDVIGRLDEAVAVIRRYVTSNGFIVISDPFIKDGGSAGFPGFEGYAEHAETVKRLTSCGDALIETVRESDAHDEDDANEGELIRSRAEGLAERHPDLATELLEFAENQAAENTYIDENLIGAIWVLQRS
jgi:SAM-dependent methyltransferase